VKTQRLILQDTTIYGTRQSIPENQSGLHLYDDRESPGRGIFCWQGYLLLAEVSSVGRGIFCWQGHLMLAGVSSVG